MVAQNLGMKNDMMLSSARFEKQCTIVRIKCFEITTTFFTLS